jgi:hypothetical protein
MLPVSNRPCWVAATARAARSGGRWGFDQGQSQVKGTPCYKKTLYLPNIRARSFATGMVRTDVHDLYTKVMDHTVSYLYQ